MKLYKLTDSKGNTRNSTHWDIGVSHAVACGEPKLCTSTVLHAYTSPLLAALMNPVHANYQQPKCFVCEGDIAVTDGTKVGCQSLKVTGTFELPVLTSVQKAAFGIYAALVAYKEPKFAIWAELWLSGKDRSYHAARDAARAAYAAARDARDDAAAAAYARAAASAAYVAADAADAADDADAAAAAVAADAAAAATTFLRGEFICKNISLKLLAH